MWYRRGTEVTYQVVIHALVGVIALSALFPLVYVIGMSLTSQVELIQRGYFVIIPHEPKLNAYIRLLDSAAMWRALLMSVMRSTVGPLLGVALTLVGAYVLSHRTLPGRNLLLLIVLLTILFHGGMIPTYLVVRNLGVMNTFWALIVPLLVDSFGLLIIKIFIENLPEGLVESARLDGAGHVQLLVWIVTPLAAPALAAIGMFNIVQHWNSWFDALLYLHNKNLWPLQLVLRNLLEGQAHLGDDLVIEIMKGEKMALESFKMATVIIGVVPMLALYPFLQRFFIHGVYLGAVKG